MTEPIIRTLITVQERLSDQVARALRAALVSGDLHPGAIYSAPALAADFGVSATPVRDAMHELVGEGRMEIVRNRGFRVIGRTERDLAEYAELRALIEIPTIDRIARTATREQVETVRRLAEETLAAAERQDLAGYLTADRRCHLALLALAGNARLVETAGKLHDRSTRPVPIHLDRPDELIQHAAERLRLLDLTLAGDTDAIIAQHLGHERSVPPGLG